MTIHFFENRETRKMQTTIDFYAHFEIPCIANRSVMDVITIGTDQGKQNGRIKKGKKAAQKERYLWSACGPGGDSLSWRRAPHNAHKNIYLKKKKNKPSFILLLLLGDLGGCPVFVACAVSSGSN